MKPYFAIHALLTEVTADKSYIPAAIPALE